MTNTPFAPDKSTRSNKSLFTAILAASSARPSPGALLAEPKPIIACPISDMTVRTSAKSTLINPGEVIISEMPVTELRKTSFAAENACMSVAFLGITLANCSFGMIIKESTCFDNSLIPISANIIRFLPSKENGFVTTATVRIPNSFAI